VRAFHDSIRFRIAFAVMAQLADRLGAERAARAVLRIGKRRQRRSLFTRHMPGHASRAVAAPGIFRAGSFVRASAP
jgi:hypothetical protein